MSLHRALLIIFVNALEDINVAAIDLLSDSRPRIASLHRVDPSKVKREELTVEPFFGMFFILQRILFLLLRTIDTLN